MLRKLYYVEKWSDKDTHGMAYLMQRRYASNLRAAHRIKNEIGCGKREWVEIKDMTHARDSVDESEVER